MSDNRTEAEVLTKLFWDHPGNIPESMIVVAAKVRELDAPGHAKAVEEAFSAGRTSGAFFPPKPPQPPKPKTAGEAARAAFNEPNTIDERFEAAAQAAYEFLSKPKVTAGELWRAMIVRVCQYGVGRIPLGTHETDEAEAQAFLRLAREHGLLEGQP